MSCRSCPTARPGEKPSASKVREDLPVFVWLFHRISGILLVVLLPLQMATGILQGGSSGLKTANLLHGDMILNTLLAFLVIFHGLYGVRTILLDLGLKWEKQLFWVFTLLGVVLFAGFLYFFYVVLD
jgi:succinate dehydrogenase/fumarate reductase cytochrome b subunit